VLQEQKSSGRWGGYCPVTLIQLFPCHTEPFLFTTFRASAQRGKLREGARARQGFFAGACPEHHEILRGVYPERDSSVALLPQNDRKRRAQNDRQRRAQNDRQRRAQNDNTVNSYVSFLLRDRGGISQEDRILSCKNLCRNSSPVGERAFQE